MLPENVAQLDPGMGTPQEIEMAASKILSVARTACLCVYDITIFIARYAYIVSSALLADFIF